MHMNTPGATADQRSYIKVIPRGWFKKDHYYALCFELGCNDVGQCGTWDFVQGYIEAHGRHHETVDSMLLCAKMARQ